MKEVLKNIWIAGKSYLKGDMNRQYGAVVLLSNTIKTEKLPEGTKLPVLMRYKVKPDDTWPDHMQRVMCDFLSSQFQATLAGNKKVLIVSDGGKTRPTAAVVRLLIHLGFKRSDAVKMVVGKTGFTPDTKTTKGFPGLDEKRLPFIAKCVFGKERALASAKITVKQFGLTDKEVGLIPDLSQEEIAREG